MLEAVSIDRSRVSERIARLPPAGTRITADRGARRDRPASAAASGSETTDFLHREACRLAAREAQHRVVQARLIAALMKRRLWRPLGFVRLSDYAAERLGVRARSLQEDARVANSLELLPRIRSAVGIGALRWTHARLLAGMATPATEDEWLRMALVSTTRRLAELVKAARRGDAGATDADPDACALVRRAGESSPERPDPDACALPRRVSKSSPERLHPDACASFACAGKSAPERLHPDACASPGCAGESSPDHLHPDACASQIDAASSCTLRGCAASADPEESESDPPLFWSMDVTRAGRRLWRVVGDLASRMCGTDVPASRVAEAVAAEAMSWVAWEPPLSESMPPRARRARAISELTQDFAVEESERFREPDRVLEKLALDVDSASAHEIDRRLRIVRSTMQRIDAELGAVLRKSCERNVPRRLGFPDLRLYSEIRLGICGSKAMALVRLDRQCAQRSPALLQAYREGRVSWLAATTLLPVISRKHGNAWIERARSVTLRRLEAEVSWTLDRADETRGYAPQAPPPLDLDVTADAFAGCETAEIQMRAHPGTDLESFGRRVDARIGIVIPASIAALLDDAIEGCRHAVEPRWRGFERILAHAWLTWMALPKHDNPVYARDNHRCQVPGCRSRAPLHAHHIWFRSKGGPDASWNLVCVCDAHHRAIHRGEIHVHGRAPDGLVWELGCRPGCPPLLRLRGDVYWKE